MRIFHCTLAFSLCLLGCAAEEPLEPSDTPEPPVDEMELPDPPPPSQPAYAWARLLAGPSDEDEIDAVTSDHDGNAIVSGKFETSLVVEGATAPLTSAGMADIMVAKYGATGELRWLRQFGGPGEDNVFDADTDSDGNIYLSGYFGGTVNFGGVSLTSAGKLDMFVVKLAPDGNTLWALRGGGPGDDGGNEITVTDGGVVTVVAGSGDDFGVGNVLIPYSGAHQFGIVIRLDGASGAVQWATHVASATTGAVRLKCLAVDTMGNVYAGGDYGGSVTAVGPNRSESLPATSGALDAFVTAWTPTGDLRWSKGWGGTGADLCKGLAATDTGELYAVGYASDSARFDQTLLPIVGRDLFVWKLTGAGSSIWLVQISSTSDLSGAEVVLTPDGGVLFGHDSNAAVTYGSTSGQALMVQLPSSVDWPLLVGYTPAGVPRLPLLPAMNTGDAHMDEISRSGRRAYIDVPIFGGTHEFGSATRTGGSSKDALLVAVDL